MASTSSDQDDLDKDLLLALGKAIRQKSQTNDFSDVTIDVEGKLFETHRFLLSAWSGFFQGMFTSGMKEQNEKCVKLSSVSAETFTLIMQSISECKNVLTESNCNELWRATDMLQILPLKAVCETYITSNMSLKNCFDIYQTASLLNSKSVADKAWTYILDHFQLLKDSPGLNHLSPRDIISLVYDDNLRTNSSEDSVLKVIINWTIFIPDCEEIFYEVKILKRLRLLFPKVLKFEGPILRKIACARCAEGFILRKALYYTSFQLKLYRSKGLFEEINIRRNEHGLFFVVVLFFVVSDFRS